MAKTWRVIMEVREPNAIGAFREEAFTVKADNQTDAIRFAFDDAKQFALDENKNFIALETRGVVSCI